MNQRQTKFRLDLAALGSRAKILSRDHASALGLGHSPLHASNNISSPTTVEWFRSELPSGGRYWARGLRFPLTMSLPQLPHGFTDLSTAFNTNDQSYNVIGVCVDFLPVTRSKGSDMTIKFTLHDPTWFDGAGMTFRFFHKDGTRLPSIKNAGDIVILTNVRTVEKMGQRFAWSNSATGWAVLSGASVVDSQCPRGSDIAIERSGGPSKGPPRHPSVPELVYAKAIREFEDPTMWPTPAKATSLQIENIMRESGGKPPARKEKYRLIQDLGLPADQRYMFVDLFGEVRRIFANDLKVELYITDYTANDGLYNYQYGDHDGGCDGDQFGYIQGTHNLWPGPWGKMTLSVILFDNHAAFVRREVREGSFVQLKNVQIKIDHNGTKLEGVCRGDKYNPSKCNVAIHQPRKADGDERFKALLQRKRHYEAEAKKENIRFSRNAQMKKRPGKAESGGGGDDDHDDDNNKAPEHKAKRPRGKNQKKEAKRKAEVEQAAAAKESKALEANSNVRCMQMDVPRQSIDAILDPDILCRTTAQGHAFSVPFQNCCYKCKVRVIDYFPDSIADFAAPVQPSNGWLSDDDSDDSDSHVAGTPEGGHDVKWEWRFFLLVEDARPPGSKEQAQMELLIADTDGEYLLNMEACDLRNRANASQLAKVKEKLFHLWGDLQERKEESTTAKEAWRTKPNARPFECFIKEYGVPARGDDGEVRSDCAYDRMFRLFGTTV